MYQYTLNIIGLMRIRELTLDFDPQIRDMDAVKGEVGLESVPVSVCAARSMNGNCNARCLPQTV